jgi:hypothetical protein
MRKSLTLATLATMTAAALLSVAPAARADDIGITEDGRGAAIHVKTNGGIGGDASVPSGRTCRYTPNADLNVGLAGGSLRGGLVQKAAVGTFFDFACSDGDTGLIFVPDGPPARTRVYVDALVRRAYRYLPLPSLRIGVNPPAGRDQLVAFPSWLWIAPATWGERSATASVPGLSATATATPVSVTWTLGDGHQVVCNGPGTPYRPGDPPGAASPDCGYTYRSSSAGQPDERYRVSATTRWRITCAGADHPQPAWRQRCRQRLHHPGRGDRCVGRARPRHHGRGRPRAGPGDHRHRAHRSCPDPGRGR